MMFFTDGLGRTWFPDWKPEKIFRLAGKKANSMGEACRFILERIEENPAFVLDVLFDLCEEQCLKRQMDEYDFVEMMDELTLYFASRSLFQTIMEHGNPTPKRPKVKLKTLSGNELKLLQTVFHAEIVEQKEMPGHETKKKTV